MNKKPADEMTTEAPEMLADAKIPRSDVPIVQTLIEELLQKLAENQEVNLYLRRRADLMLWVGVAMLAVLTLGAALRIYNYTTLRANVDAVTRQLADATTALKAEVAKNSRLRVEIAIREARYSAAKAWIDIGNAVDAETLRKINRVVDEYAAQVDRSDAVPTYDAARREACIALKAAGFPCE